MRDLIIELLESVDDVVDELGSRKELQHIHKILAVGSIADRQLKVYHESGGDLKAVVDLLMEETLEGVL